MYRTPLNEKERNKERNIIKQIAIGLLLQKSKLAINQKHKLTKQIPYKPTYKNLSINDKIKYTTFTYYGNITRKLSKLIKDTNLQISYNTDI